MAPRVINDTIAEVTKHSDRDSVYSDAAEELKSTEPKVGEVDAAISNTVAEETEADSDSDSVYSDAAEDVWDSDADVSRPDAAAERTMAADMAADRGSPVLDRPPESEEVRRGLSEWKEMCKKFRELDPSCTYPLALPNFSPSFSSIVLAHLRPTSPPPEISSSDLMDRLERINSTTQRFHNALEQIKHTSPQSHATSEACSLPQLLPMSEDLREPACDTYRGFGLQKLQMSAKTRKDMGAELLAFLQSAKNPDFAKHGVHNAAEQLVNSDQIESKTLSSSSSSSSLASSSSSSSRVCDEPLPTAIKNLLEPAAPDYDVKELFERLLRKASEMGMSFTELLKDHFNSQLEDLERRQDQREEVVEKVYNRQCDLEHEAVVDKQVQVRKELMGALDDRLSNKGKFTSFAKFRAALKVAREMEGDSEL